VATRVHGLGLRLAAEVPDVTPPALTEQDFALGRRLRQAAVGCTVHGHGPLNALAEIIRRQDAGELDGVELVGHALEDCRLHLLALDPDSPTAARERKVASVLEVVLAGLEER
jgi:hypothetical protein